MTATAAVPPEVDSYLAAVREALHDIPPIERDDLLAEVEVSLLEAANEGGSVTARLGPPEEFAAELRSAAGFHEQGASPASRAPALSHLVRNAIADARANPAVAGIRSLATELAPIWWVARAYVAVAAYALATNSLWLSSQPALPRIGSLQLAIALLVLTAAGSVWLGLWSRRRRGNVQRLLLALNLLLLVAAIPVLDHLKTPALHGAATLTPQPEPAPASVLSYAGTPVDNIYPYSRDGRLLHDVLLYDGAGRPLELRTSDANRRVLRGPGSTLIFNSYPIRYFEPGTKQVARPNAGPPIDAPRIVTPPLRSVRGR